MKDKRANVHDPSGTTHHISAVVKQIGLQVAGCDFTHTQVGSRSLIPPFWAEWISCPPAISVSWLWDVCLKEGKQPVEGYLMCLGRMILCVSPHFYQNSTWPVMSFPPDYLGVSTWERQPGKSILHFLILKSLFQCKYLRQNEHKSPLQSFLWKSYRCFFLIVPLPACSISPQLLHLLPLSP